MVVVFPDRFCMTTWLPRWRTAENPSALSISHPLDSPDAGGQFWTEQSGIGRLVGYTAHRRKTEVNRRRRIVRCSRWIRYRSTTVRLNG